MRVFTQNVVLLFYLFCNNLIFMIHQNLKFLVILVCYFLAESPLLIAQSDSLSSKLKIIEQEIYSVEKEINFIETKLDSLRKERTAIIQIIEKNEIQNNSDYIIAKASIFGILRSEPAVSSEVIKRFDGGEELKIYDFYEEPYFKAEWEGKVGYISKGGLDNLGGEIENIIIRSISLDNPKLGRLIRKYGESNANRIMKGDVWIGMSDDMARDMLGSPKSINRSNGSWGVHEQWVYSNQYLYFENGKLSSWQN